MNQNHQIPAQPDDPPRNPNQFQPGVSGNPAGRPKGSKDGIRARLRRHLNAMAPEQILQKFEQNGMDLEDNDYIEIITYRLVMLAVQGNLKAIKICFDQTESPLPRQVDLGGDMIVVIDPKSAGNL